MRRQPWKVSEKVAVVESCSDWKPSDHLGIKIPRIGLPLFGLCIRMNAEESGSRIRKMGRWLPVPVL